ncbi:MAG: DUF488 domain-containing protein [Gemmatimonadota bacterium]
MTAIATIGYQAATVPSFLLALTDAGIELLVDIRAVASSRRPGFSKTALAANLQGAGIDYLHLRGLGTPAEGRAAARAGKHDIMRDIFLEHMETTAAQRELETLSELTSARRVCVLCFEADPAHCHRSIVVEALNHRRPLRVTHLMPRDE